jgi:hypothetical protein
LSIGVFVIVREVTLLPRRVRQVPVTVLLSAISVASLTALQAPQAREDAKARIGAALGKGDLPRALSAYDAYVTSRKPDLELLRPIARATLDVAARGAAPRVVAAPALERLAGAGDPSALRTLRDLAASDSPDTPDTAAATLALARLGDKAGVERLGALIAGASDISRPQLIRAMRGADVRALAPKLASLLSAGGQTAAAAALALGELQIRDVIPQLQTLFDHGQGVVKLAAGVALTRAGVMTADEYVSAALANQTPDIRLIAAEAYQDSKRMHWIPFVEDLRTDPNEIARVRAAELLSCCRVAMAKEMLRDALRSQNPTVRAEAARVLDTRGLSDAATARRLLQDEFPIVRVYGAGPVVRAR